MGKMSQEKMHHTLLVVGLSSLFLLMAIAFPFFTPAGGSSGLPQAPGPQESLVSSEGEAPGGNTRRVGIQAGHWKASELPSSMEELRSSTGAKFQDLLEVDVNLDIALKTAQLLRDRGWTVDLFGALVPQGYLADAFVAIHADWGGDPRRRGWKMAPPWRPSPAALGLEADLKGSFYRQDLAEDDQNITVNMRGYYAFNHRYYSNAVSPHTPAVLVELGYLTNERDRLLLTEGAQTLAGVLADGLDKALRRPLTAADRQIPELGSKTAGSWGALVRRRPDPESGQIAELKPGQKAFLLQIRGEWVEVFVQTPQALTGWVFSGDLK